MIYKFYFNNFVKNVKSNEQHKLILGVSFYVILRSMFVLSYGLETANALTKDVCFYYSIKTKMLLKCPA